MNNAKENNIFLFFAEEQIIKSPCNSLIIKVVKNVLRLKKTACKKANISLGISYGIRDFWLYSFNETFKKNSMQKTS